MAFVCPSSKRVATEHSDTGSQREFGRAAPSSADCTEPVVSTAAFATEQRSMPQECDAQSGTVKIEEPVVSTTVLATEQRSMSQECAAQSGCMVFVRPTSKRVVRPSWKIVGIKHSDTGPRRKKLRQRHLHPGENMCKLYPPSRPDMLVMCWLHEYSKNICVCTNWCATTTGFVSQMRFLLGDLCITCM